MAQHLTFNEYLQQIFSCKVYKVSVDANFTCPNRDGTKGFEGCIYCDEFGSSSRVHSKKTSIREQIFKNIEVRRSRYSAKKFICYFQSFSNTYAKVENLKKIYDEAISSHPDIVGLAVSTRADCLDEEKIDLIASYKKYLPFVSIELGMQSAHDKTLQLINRQETHEDFVKACKLIKNTDIHLCTHVILGLPGESIQDMLQTAKCLSRYQVDGVKLHLLIALKNTKLASMYKEKKWKPLDLESYIKIAKDFIDILPQKCIIHRTVGSGYPKDIVAPKWVYTKKNHIMDSILASF
ncbi:MAG: TIGR01212 family radical SAM protein [Parachlamydiales bacterium]|jgi:hypothetical protein